MNTKQEKILSRIEKLSPAEKLDIAKMILMSVADFDYEGISTADTLWNAKDLIIDFEQNVGLA